jgi:hypothetical protein
MSPADRRSGRRCARPLGTTSVELAGDGQEAVADAHIQTEVSCEEAAVAVLALPDLEQAKAAVLNRLTSASGQRTCDHAITEFAAWYCSEPGLAFNLTVVLRYRIHLEQRRYAPATINLRLAAVRRVAFEAADAGLLSPELAASIRRVKGVRRLGVRLGNWLTAEQGRRLLQTQGPLTLRGLRDHAFWPCCSVVDCAEAGCSPWNSSRSNSAKSTGASPICSAKPATSAPSRCRSGSKPALTRGRRRPAWHRDGRFAPSIRPVAPRAGTVRVVDVVTGRTVKGSSAPWRLFVTVPAPSNDDAQVESRITESGV